MEFQVNTNNVILAQINQVESGEYNVTECRFIFSSEYEELTKIAVFTGANGDAYKITILNNKCEIPSELLTESQIVQIGVYAYEVQGTEFILRYSPMPTRFMIEKGSYVVNAVNMSRPTPSEIEQLQSQITHNANDIDVLEGNILNLQEEQVEQNRNIQANADDIEEIQQEQITQNTNIQKNTDDIVNINQAIDTINTDITDIDSAIGDINEDIDNLEQDLTNYSLITETGSQINLNVNSTNYKITAILKDKNGNVIYTSNAIDLPIESMIINASYDNMTKEIVLTLQNGNTLRISIADLVSGLVSETQLQTILANYYNKTEIDNLLSNLAGRVSTNEEDIADIKAEQTTQNTNIEELQNQVETLQEDLESANAEIEELNTDITNMAKAMYKVDGQGTDITLENTSENKFVEFGLEGRTEQEQLSGKNFLNIPDGTFTSRGITTNRKNGVLTISGTYGPGEDVLYFVSNAKITTIPAGTYIVSIDESISSFGLILAFHGKSWINVTFTPNAKSVTVTFEEDKDTLSIYPYNVPAGSSLNLTIKPMVRLSSVTDGTWEKYCGGIPSPNPDFPQQIKNVTGNANVKIQNKNLFDGEIELGSINPANGELQVNAGRTRSKNFIKVKPNTTYTISVQTGQYRWIVGYNARKVGITDGNVGGQASSLSSFPVSIYSTTNTFTTTATTEYIKWYDTNSTDLTEKVQIEEGTTATSYVPHQEQNYPFTFSEGQRGMQGTQLLDDGIHNKRKQVVFDGSNDEEWSLKNAGVVQFNIAIPNIASIAGLCDKMLCKVNYETEGKPYMRMNSGAIWLDLGSGILEETTVENLRTWLSENPLTVEYILAEEEKILYNETQQAQYNAIKQARSYDDITYITSTSDELGFNMNVVAVANANKVIDNQNNEIDTIKSRLDLLEG